ncbi:MAG TPA: hypothetical protein VEP93_12285 [Variovorax sp.]|nr:hypothetical protein [Variovorax sp.]
MSIEPIPMNAFQKSILARAQAVTREQLELSKELVMTSLGGAMTPDEQRGYAVQVAQALATNYLAETLNSKLGK